MAVLFFTKLNFCIISKSLVPIEKSEGEKKKAVSGKWVARIFIVKVVWMTSTRKPSC